MHPGATLPRRFVGHLYSTSFRTTICLSLFAILAICHLGAQTEPTPLPSSDATVQANTPSATPSIGGTVVPQPLASLGQMDAAALTEVKAYGAALGGNQRWLGMQATGTITYASDPTPYSATLTNVGHSEFRLDTQNRNGPISIRVHGRSGAAQFGNNPVMPMDPDTAVLGIFPFEIVGKANPAAKSAALLDRGSDSTNGVPLHRVTLAVPSASLSISTKSQGTVPIDLYFDPVTHLLVKSVCTVFVPGARHVPFLSVVTYSDYRPVGNSVVPFQYSESINGRPYQTLQLTAVQLNPSLPADYFQFERTKQ